MIERRARLALVSIALLFALWGLCYIYRTSAVVVGTRMFLLWGDGMISMRRGTWPRATASHGIRTESGSRASPTSA